MSEVAASVSSAPNRTDAYRADVNGRYHRPEGSSGNDGAFISDYERELIDAHFQEQSQEQSEPITEAPAAEPEAYTVVSIDESRTAESRSRDAAEDRLKDEISAAKERGKFRGFMTGLWKGGIFKETYLDKYRMEALNEKREAQDVNAADNTISTDIRARAIEKTIERYSSDAEGLIEEGAGERREVHENESELSGGMKELIARYARGELTDDGIAEEQKLLLQQYREEHGAESVGRGIVTTTNLLEVAQAIKGRVEHEESLESALDRVRLVTGEARNDARTEHRKGTIDSVLAKLSAKTGGAVTPAAVVAGATLAATFARWGSKSTIGAAAKFIVPVAGAALVAGYSAWARVKRERVQHSRDMAFGGELRGDEVGRAEIERARYETASAPELTATLRGEIDSLDDESSPEKIQGVIELLAQIQTRVDISNQRGVDLLSFSDGASIGEERMELHLARSEAHVAIDGRLTAELRQALGLTDDMSLTDFIGNQSEQYLEIIDQDTSAKDRAFRGITRKHVAISAAAGALAGATAGLIVQEAVAGADSTRYGLVDMALGRTATPIDGVEHQTLLTGLARGDEHIVHTGPSQAYDTISTSTVEGAHGQIEFSDEHTLQMNETGTAFSLVDGNGAETINGIAVGPDGVLPEESIEALEDAGMVVEDRSWDEELTTETTTVLSGQEFVANNADTAATVEYSRWYNNNTAVYDQNELRLTWGGSGLTDNGYKMSVAGMTSNGSYVGDASVDWRDAQAEGKMFLAVSASPETVNNPFLIPIGSDGVAEIPYDHPAAALFSQDGRVSFNGHWAQAVELTGTNPDGSVEIASLATHVGEQTNSFADTVVTSYTEHHAEYTITTAGYDTTVEHYTETPPVIPIIPFRNLEALRKRREYGYYGGERSLTAQELAARTRETSPRLLRDPAARLTLGEELAWYKKQVGRDAPKGYLEDIERGIASSPEMQQPRPGLKAVVTIPVGAVGEADNIYRTLSAYAQQDPEAIAATKLLLHVNWMDSAEADPEKAAAIAKTKQEIERARADFPQLSIATFESTWSQEKLDRREYGRGLIGHVAQKLYDTALLSVQEQVAKGAIPPDNDVLLIRNDADAQGIDRHYLQRMIDATEAHSETDVFTGAVRWDTRRHRDLPGFAFVGNLLEIMNIAAYRDNDTSLKKTAGINTAVRMSTFAAVGSIGHDQYETGAGSDDMAIGRRIHDVRSGKIVKRNSRRRSYQNLGRQSREAAGYQRTVAGAGIDTKGDRIEQTYLSDDPEVTVASTWDRFDSGGYQARSTGLDGANRKESLKASPQEITKRIEKNISGVMKNWGMSPAQLAAGLSVMIPIDSQKPTYKISYNRGTPEFRFTDEGAKWLMDHLARDSRGRFDPLGSRIRRQLYNERPPAGKRTLVSDQPRFV